MVYLPLNSVMDKGLIYITCGLSCLTFTLP